MQKNKLDKLRVAIVHDLLVEYGGAEEVFFNILELFPRADVFTSLVDPSGWMYKKVKHNIKNSFINWEYVHTLESVLKPFVFSFFDNLDLADYDLVISSSGSFSAKAIVTLPSTLSVCYCHTTPKYLYSEFSESNGILSSPLKKLISLLMRPADFVAAQRPDIMIVNSYGVGRRVKKYYKRDSFVIYPPVDIPANFKSVSRPGNYYVYIGRLYKQKGLDLIIDAFNKNTKRLVVIGQGGMMKRLKNRAKTNIEFKGFLSQAKKIEILKKAKGLVFAGRDEDFGMSPVEGMAYGIPVIAYKSGGVTETVIDGKTGIFFNKYTSGALNEAIKRFESMKFDKKLCWREMRKFSKNHFKTRFLGIINSNL